LLRHASGSTLIVIGLLVYTACAFTATWVYYSFDRRLRLRRFPIVFVAGIAPFLLAAFLGQLLAGVLPGQRSAGGMTSYRSSRVRRPQGPGLASAVLDADDASRILGGPAAAPANSDTWWMPRGSIGTCDALEGPGRVYLLVYPRERAPRRILSRLSSVPSVERIRGQPVAMAGNERWVVRAALRGGVCSPTVGERLGSLAEHALESLRYA
jgi:hypothetical protein